MKNNNEKLRAFKHAVSSLMDRTLTGFDVNYALGHFEQGQRAISFDISQEKKCLENAYTALEIANGLIFAQKLASNTTSIYNSDQKIAWINQKGYKIKSMDDLPDVVTTAHLDLDEATQNLKFYRDCRKYITAQKKQYITFTATNIK